MSNLPFRDLQLDPQGRLVLTDLNGVAHVGVTPVRAHPISAPDEGLSLVGAHGRHDRITSFAQTVDYLERARPVAADVALHDMGPLGHYMLTGAGAWNKVALEASLAMLGGLRA